MRALSQVTELRDICEGLMSTCKTLSTAQQFDIESAIKLYAPWEEGATEQLHSSLLPAADADSAPHLQPRQSLLADDGCVNVRSKGGLVNIRNLRLPSALQLDTTVAAVKDLISEWQEKNLTGVDGTSRKPLRIEASAALARCSHV